MTDPTPLSEAEIAALRQRAETWTGARSGHEQTIVRLLATLDRAGRSGDGIDVERLARAAHVSYAAAEDIAALYAATPEAPHAED